MWVADDLFHWGCTLDPEKQQGFMNPGLTWRDFNSAGDAGWWFLYVFVGRVYVFFLWDEITNQFTNDDPMDLCVNAVHLSLGVQPKCGHEIWQILTRVGTCVIWYVFNKALLNTCFSSWWLIKLLQTSPILPSFESGWTNNRVWHILSDLWCNRLGRTHMNVNVQTPQGLEAPVPLSVRFVYGHVDAMLPKPCSSSADTEQHFKNGELTIMTLMTNGSMIYVK